MLTFVLIDCAAKAEDRRLARAEPPARAGAGLLWFSWHAPPAAAMATAAR